jgi:hypothetical protein
MHNNLDGMGATSVGQEGCDGHYDQARSEAIVDDALWP